MTLIVSVHVPDGIVLAADSLTTVTPDHITEKKTLQNTQKIIPFCDKFGVGFSGRAFIKNKSLPYYIRSLEKELKEAGNCPQCTCHAMKEIKKEIKTKIGTALPQPTDCVDKADYHVHLVGFDNGIFTTRKFTINNQQDDGTPVNGTRVKCLGFSCTGYEEVTQALSSLYCTPEGPTKHKPKFELMSLKEGIRYAEFLIRTTELHLQFSGELPKVGGNIDVAVITPFDGFEWIRQQLYLE